MAFNNGFPMTYQPVGGFYAPTMGQMGQMGQVPQMGPMQQVSPQPQIQAPLPAPTTPQGIIWVQGEAGAKSYLVAPNTTVQLWDSENYVIYLKSADASGMPSMKIIDYKIRDAASPIHIPSPDAGSYVKEDDFSAFRAEVEKRFKEVAENDIVTKKGEKVNESDD